MPWHFGQKTHQVPQRHLYTPHNNYQQARPLGNQAPGGGYYPDAVAVQPPTSRPGNGGGGGGGLPQGYVMPAGATPPKPQERVSPKDKMRNVVKQLQQVINEQKGRVNELRRDARKSLNTGDKDSYELYVDNMVHVRMFIRKITKAITNVKLVGTNMDINRCNGMISVALADFLKEQGENVKVDMDEVTRNYFDQQMSLDNGLEAFLENMKDLDDPEGVMEEERARERARIEAEFGRNAVVSGPEKATPAFKEAQAAREAFASN